LNRSRRRLTNRRLQGQWRFCNRAFGCIS
jgi:hypothetical protein